MLALQALTPNEIALHFDSSRQAVSKHLKVLHECELVKPQQQGREIYYTIEIERMKEVDQWLQQFRKIWETRFIELDTILMPLNHNQNEN
mgnify:CR=1 FL=1